MESGHENEVQARVQSGMKAHARDAEDAARQNRSRTARSVWSARSLLPLSNHPTPYDSASKLDALQTLRVAVHPKRPSQPANNFDCCNDSFPFAFVASSA